MKTTLKLKDKEFKITGKLVNEGVKFPNMDDKDTLVHNQFRITIKLNGNTNSFNWYDSMANYEEGKIELEEEDLKYAFRSHLEDGRSGNNTYEDFCSVFGYDEDSRRAERIFKACEKALEQLNKLGLSVKDLDDLIDELSKMGIE